MACGLLNAGYFAGYWWRHDEPRGRRAGAVVLVLVSLAAVVEAIFSQRLFWWQQGVAPFTELSTGAWALARLPIFASMVLISVVVVRRMRM